MDRSFDSVRETRGRRRRARRFAVLLHHCRRRGQAQILRRHLGPSSWRCHPHAGPHPERESAD